MVDLNQVLSPIRPLTQLIGTVLLIAGLAKFFGVNIPINGGGLELAVAGYLLKTV
jgi:hypothetical protein